MAQLLDETDDGALPQTKFMHTHSYVANTYKFDTNKYLERYNHMKATTDNKIEEVSNFKLFVSAYFYHPYYIPGKWHKPWDWNVDVWKFKSNKSKFKLRLLWQKFLTYTAKSRVLLKSLLYKFSWSLQKVSPRGKLEHTL